MTQEEKAKAYDKAIKRAKERIKDYEKRGLKEQLFYAKEDLEGIFPELKESEDERMKKSLKRLIAAFYDCNFPTPEGFTREELYAWLEKQGEQKSMPQEYAEAFDEFISHIPEKEPEFSESCYNYDDMVSAIQFGIKWQQHNSIVKVEPKYEPKFHEGDWVIGRATENEPRQIAEITEEGYKSTYGGWYGFSFEEDMHLWTIEDAKPGDVLICNEEILLFKSYSVKGCISLYCWYNGQTNNFHSKEVVDTSLTTRNKICPATKEQRDILMKVMADAGYTFDFEKKELKKIEQNPTWSEEQIRVCKEVYADLLSAKGFDISTVNSELNRLEKQLKKLKEE